MSERDVTDEVEWRKIPRLLGKWKADEIWHRGVKIGHVEAMGPVLTDKTYKLTFKPSRTDNLQQRILRVENETGTEDHA
jgi:hypothetical protein